MSNYLVIDGDVVEDNVAAAEKRELINQRLEQRSGRLARERESRFEDTHESQIRANSIVAEAKVMRHKIADDMKELEGKASALKPLDLTDALDSLAKSHASAEKHLSQHTAMLPIYEVRAMQAGLQKIGDEFRALQDALQPKKKFGFSGRKNKTTEKKEEEEPVKVQAASVARDIDGYSVSDRKDETVTVASDDVTSKDVILSRMERCKIYILGSPSTLHVTHLKDCVVLCGPVATSVFVDECADATFALACQQLRVHTTKNTDFFLHVTSRAIVEDCGGVRFGPYNLCYDGKERDYKSSGLDRGVDNWEKVNDFNWLAGDKASPNWSLVPKEEWKEFNI